MASSAVTPASVRSSVDSQGRPWLTSIAVIGDFGNVSQMKNNLYDEKVPANYVGEAIRQINPDSIISLGDDNYIEGKPEWKDFNVGKNYAPFIYPYTVSKANSGNPEALAFADPGYLASQVARRPWNRFFPLPGNHEVGMSGGVGFMYGSGRRDVSHDFYYKAALEGAKTRGSVIPLASSYVLPGDDVYFDYSYKTPLMPAAWFTPLEGSMDRSYYDYLVKPVNKDGVVLNDLANIYMVDRNNSAYGTKNSGYARWKKKNPSKLLDPQADFLMAEAKRRKNEVPWQIFASHYETYSSDNFVADPSSKGIRPATHLPYFDSGYDLVLGAHVHNYERLRNPDSAGVVGDYIVNGNGGYNTAYLAGTAGIDQVFSFTGQAPGYQAGTTGTWGFGLIDMNKEELQYRQFNVQFNYLKNPNPSLIAGDYLFGQDPLDQVKVVEVDRLVRRASPAGSTASVETARPLKAAMPVTTGVRPRVAAAPVSTAQAKPTLGYSDPRKPAKSFAPCAFSVSWLPPSVMESTQPRTLSFAENPIQFGLDGANSIVSYVNPWATFKTASGKAGSANVGIRLDLGKVQGSIDSVTGAVSIALNQPEFELWGTVDDGLPGTKGDFSVNQATPVRIPLKSIKNGSSSLVLNRSAADSISSANSPQKGFNYKAAAALAAPVFAGSPKDARNQAGLLAWLDAQLLPGLTKESGVVEFGLSL